LDILAGLKSLSRYEDDGTTDEIADETARDENLRKRTPIFGNSFAGHVMLWFVLLHTAWTIYLSLSPRKHQ
jgi:hypothetical protein